MMKIIRKKNGKNLIFSHLDINLTLLFHVFIKALLHQDFKDLMTRPSILGSVRPMNFELDSELRESSVSAQRKD